MARMRKHNKPPFVQIPNNVAFDTKLSFRARGVLVYLLAKPAGWDVRSEAIARDGKEGRDAIRAALRELAARGHYRIVRVLKGGAGGTWHTFTDVSFEPVPEWAAEYVKSGDKPIVIKDPAVAADYFEEPPAPDQDSDPEGGFSGSGESAPGDRPKTRNPTSGEADSGESGPIERPVTADGDKEVVLPAVGEVQHRKGEPCSGLRPGKEDHPTEPDAVVRVGDIRAVYEALPDQVRGSIGTEASPPVIDAIRAELAAGTRTAAQLCERVARRWAAWQGLGEQLRDPVGMAVNLVRPERTCADVWCEDGLHVETGERCTACPPRPRPVDAEPPVVVVPAPRPRPDDGTVAEVLAPVPYEPEPDESAPSRPVGRRVPSGPPPGILDALRPRLHALRGMHDRPRERELAGAVA